MKKGPARLVLLLAAWLLVKPLAACTITGATLQFSGDDNINFSLNGHVLASCTACWSTLNTHVFTATELGWINALGDNMLAVRGADTGGLYSGSLWLLTLTYSDCATQYVMSDAACTYSYYAGNGGGAISPPGWDQPNFNDLAWSTPFDAATGGGLDWTRIPMPGGGGGNVPWIWGNTNFSSGTTGDVYLFRDHFQLGSSACVTSQPLAVIKSVSAVQAQIGDALTYTLIANNSTFTTSLPGGLLWDSLPTGVSFVGSVPSPSSSTPPYYTWTVPGLTPGQSYTVQLNVQLAAGVNNEIKDNWASGMATGYAPIQSADAPFSVEVPGAVLSKSASVATAAVGDTVTYSISYPAPSGSSDSSSHLNLQVEGAGTAMSNSQLDFKFRITNNSAAPVSLNNLMICYWIDDPVLLGSLSSYNINNSGVVQPGGIWGQATWSPFIFSAVGPYVRPDGRNANRQICTSATSANSLAPGAYLDAIEIVAQPFGSPSSNFNTANQTTTYYSQRPNLESSYVDDAHFVLYNNGSQVLEYSAPGVQDAQTGLQPQLWAKVWDTVPSSINYLGSTPAATNSGGLLSWLGGLFPGLAGTFQFWGTVKAGTASGTVIHNQASYTDPNNTGLSNDCTVLVGTALSPTQTPSLTSSPTRSPSPSPSATPSVTMTPTASASVSPSFTASPVLSPTPSGTVTMSATATRTKTATPSFSPTQTASPTSSTTRTYTPGPPPTPTSTMTQSFTQSPTPGPVPQLFKIVAVYPNPVTDQGAYFVISLPYPADVEFKLYDLRGELVWQAKQNYPAAGNYQYHWGANNDAGNKVSYGAYYLLVKARSGNTADHDSKWLTVLR